MSKTSLSLVVITLNEEKNIERCLKSVPFASDIVVVDSGSQDRTVEIAQSLGARVFVEKFRGFGAQKNFAADQAKNDWILSLDADEALSPELAREIETFLDNNDETIDGFELPRISYHLGRWIRHGGWFPDRKLRLYNRARARWNLSPVHEDVETEKVARMHGCIQHWVFRDLFHQVDTNNKYSSLGTDVLEQKAQKFSLFKLLTKPVSKFVECYILKRGFLDGMPGFIIAVGAGYSVFLKWAKLWERQNLRSRNET